MSLVKTKTWQSVSCWQPRPTGAENVVQIDYRVFILIQCLGPASTESRRAFTVFVRLFEEVLMLAGSCGAKVKTVAHIGECRPGLYGDDLLPDQRVTGKVGPQLVSEG